MDIAGNAYFVTGGGSGLGAATAERLAAQKRRIMDLGYGEAFFRNWQYYLEICAASFAIGHTNVVQVELAHA